jgi:3-hydroxyisobutyrate dehydrogenase-like beta-hydroxyacid dehydrogenase
MPDKRIGIIGLGQLGTPVAKRIVDAGYPVIVHNRSQEPVDELVSYGAKGASSPREVSAWADITITVLPHTEAFETVVMDEEGIIEGIEQGDTLIDMETISPMAVEEVAAELEARGAHLLDSPVSGGVIGAEKGTLSVMVGGSEEILQTHRDIYEVFGGTITHCGEQGSGQITKACNQMILGVTLQVVSEALVFAKKAGADLDATVDAISEGAASCWVLDNRAPDMICDKFEPGGFTKFHYKDMRIATNAGQHHNAPMPAAELNHEMFKSAVEMGYGEEDISAVLKVFETLAGTEARID